MNRLQYVHNFTRTVLIGCYIGPMYPVAAAKANLVCWLVLKKHQFPRERMHSYSQLGVCCRARRILQLLPPGCDSNCGKHLLQLPTSPGRFPRCKTANQGCSASSAITSRRCQWGLPGGDGRDFSSRTYLVRPAQPAQLARDIVAAANKLSASLSLALTAARGEALRYTQGA